LTGDYALVLLDLLCPATPASTCLERSARMPEPASDRAGRARSRRAERGLDRGANDWVTKPFSLEELWASVRGYLRSPGQRESSVIEAGTSGWICALAALNATVTRCS
jgi:two-component system KDP operon response regulator KdpE